MRLGAPREHACAAVGITSATLRSWLHSASEGDEFYTAFADRFLKEEADYARKLVASITKAGTNDWKAHAWILERRFKKEWGATQQVEHSGQIDTAITHATPEQAANAIRAAFGQHAAVQADTVPSDD